LGGPRESKRERERARESERERERERDLRSLHSVTECMCALESFQTWSETHACMHVCALYTHTLDDRPARLTKEDRREHKAHKKHTEK